MEPDRLALLWLLGLLAGASLYFCQLYRRSDYSTWESCLYLPTYLLGRLLWRVHFTNDAPAELSGGGVLAANHRSSVDPFFVQLAARRRVHWMVAKEYCQHFAFGPLLRALQVIPTNRSGMDTACTKAALRITQAGGLVGMFPEGRINLTSAPLLPLRSGAALVASRSNVPLIPLWIEGSPLGKSVWSPVLMPARVKITFGQPLWAAWPGGGDGAQDQSGDASCEAGSPQFSQELASENDAQKSGASAEDLLVDSDALIVQWGHQILTLANCASSPVELASQRKRRNRA